MSTVNKNFIVKQGLEVAEDLIFADGNTEKVGINTSDPQYNLQVDGKLAIKNAFLVAPEDTSVANKVGILSQFAPSSITGINTNNLRVNDIVRDFNDDFISPNTRVLSIQSGIISLTKSHTNNSNGDLVTLIVTRDFDSGDQGNVLVSRGPNESPVWVESADDVQYSDDNKFYFPTFVEDF